MVHGRVPIMSEGNEASLHDACAPSTAILQHRGRADHDAALFSVKGTNNTSLFPRARKISVNSLSVDIRQAASNAAHQLP